MNLLLALPGSNAEHRRQAAFNVGLGCGPGGNADAHCCLALPDRAAAPAGAIGLKLRHDPAGEVVISKGDQHLIDNYLIENPIACCSQALGKARGMSTGPFDQIGNTSPAKRAKRRPDLDATRAPRCFRRILRWLAGFALDK